MRGIQVQQDLSQKGEWAQIGSPPMNPVCNSVKHPNGEPVKTRGLQKKSKENVPGLTNKNSLLHEIVSLFQLKKIWRH